MTLNISDILLVIFLGLSHGLDPDHVATARMMKRKGSILKFSLFHSAGFLIIALPLSLVVTIESIKQIILAGSFIIGIGIGGLLLFSAVMEKEFDLEPKIGILQGSLVLTPSKILAILIAINAGEIFLSVFVLAIFVITSTLSIALLAFLNLIPRKVSRIFNIGIAIFTIIFLTYQLIFLIS
ncbi:MULTISPECIES: hypothetical protein [Acidianus]|uniref:Nickel/cobalt efflux system n=1 Tax=Candidatus Acidianus copahuensis TaxID=1160895 RepID=A0A031LRH9_9CREN|nr:MULTISPECIES: hypothetical protein [Acidianus]EZQ07019.1 hypothetical protein CM19_06585 [Candidatus Acidianus copahuensis]NON63578.1 hypothetical protein [Acidianus sp. RZ1]